MMSFPSNLPPEILDLILDLLSRAELVVFCRVDGHLRALIEPRLYTELRWTWSFTWFEVSSGGYPRPYPTKVPPVIPFLRTIAQRPELAALVRTIDLRCGCFNSHVGSVHNRDTPALPVVGADIGALAAVVESFNVPYADVWVEALRGGEIAAVVALLLALAPHLQNLHMDEEYLPDQLIGVALGRACGTQTRPGGMYDGADMEGSTSLRTCLLRTSDKVDLLFLFYLAAATSVLQRSADPARRISYRWISPCTRKTTPSDSCPPRRI